MRRPCLRCGADLSPDPGWGGRPRQYCGAACRKAGQRLRAALGRDWWQHQPWYPAWAAADQRERQEQQDRADAEQRERDRQAEAPRQQQDEQRRKAEEDRKLLESTPPQVRAGVEAARRAEGERARRQFSLMTLRMDLDLLSQKYAAILAETGQRVQLTHQASRTEKLLWAAALAPDEAEAQALFAKARELAAKDPGQRPDAAISTADSFRAFFPPSPPGQLQCLVRHRRAGRAGTGAGLFSRSASASRCRRVSGGAASTTSRTQASRPLSGSRAARSSWSRSSCWVRAAGEALGLASRGRVPDRLVIPVPVSRCGADPLARMI